MGTEPELGEDAGDLHSKFKHTGVCKSEAKVQVSRRAASALVGKESSRSLGKVLLFDLLLPKRWR